MAVGLDWPCPGKGLGGCSAALGALAQQGLIRAKCNITARTRIFLSVGAGSGLSQTPFIAWYVAMSVLIFVNRRLSAIQFWI